MAGIPVTRVLAAAALIALLTLIVYAATRVPHGHGMITVR